MALNKGIWDPKLRGTNIKGTNLKSSVKGLELVIYQSELEQLVEVIFVIYSAIASALSY